MPSIVAGASTSMQERARAFDSAMNPLVVTTTQHAELIRCALTYIDFESTARDIDATLSRARSIGIDVEAARASVARSLEHAQQAQRTLERALECALESIDGVLQAATETKRREFSSMFESMAERVERVPDNFDTSTPCYLCASPIDADRRAWLECTHAPVPTCRDCLERAVYSLSNNARRSSINCTHCRRELSFDSVKLV